MLKNKKGEILEKLSRIPTKDDSTMIINISYTVFVYSFIPFTLHLESHVTISNFIKLCKFKLCLS